MTEQENTLQVPQDILDSARISIPELRVELALLLYEQKRLSIGKAGVGRDDPVGVSPGTRRTSNYAALPDHRITGRC